MRLGLPLINAIIQAWREDRRMGSETFSDEFLKELSEKVGFIKYGMSVKVFLARHNLMASNAMWDGNEVVAQRHLFTHGLKDNRRDSSIGHKQSQSRRNVRVAAARHEAWRDLREKSARRAWNTCKR